MRGDTARGAGCDRRDRDRNGDRGCAYFAAHADAWMEHGVHQYSAGGGAGDGAPERACEAEDSVGARDDPDFEDRQSAVCAGADGGAEALLLQCDDAFFVCAAAVDFFDRAADLSGFQAYEYSGVLGGDFCVCAAASGAVVFDQLADTGAASALVLERDL